MALYDMTRQISDYCDRVKRDSERAADEAVLSFDTMDQDGDGEMTIDELKAVITNNPMFLQCKAMLLAA